eukprot:35552-Ditylum_brightwellii.AAC.1
MTLAKNAPAKSTPKLTNIATALTKESKPKQNVPPTTTTQPKAPPVIPPHDTKPTIPVPTIPPMPTRLSFNINATQQDIVPQQFQDLLKRGKTWAKLYDTLNTGNAWVQVYHNKHTPTNIKQETLGINLILDNNGIWF